MAVALLIVGVILIGLGLVLIPLPGPGVLTMFLGILLVAAATGLLATGRGRRAR